MALGFGLGRIAKSSQAPQGWEKAFGEVARALVNLSEKTRDQLDKQDEFTIGALERVHDRIMSISEDRQVQAFVRARGLAPFFKDATSMVRAEIAALQQQLGITEEEAKNYMRSKIPTEVEEEQLNGLQHDLTE